MEYSQTVGINAHVLRDEITFPLYRVANNEDAQECCGSLELLVRYEWLTLFRFYSSCFDYEVRSSIFLSIICIHLHGFTNRQPRWSHNLKSHLHGNLGTSSDVLVFSAP